MRLDVVPFRPVHAMCAALIGLTACGGGGSNPAPTVQPPSALAYVTNPAIYTKGTAIAPNSPSSSGGKATAYAVSPSLPAGLALDSITGILAGTPMAVAATTAYTISASNAGGAAKATLTLTVNDLAPTFTYGTVPMAFAKGTAIPALAPTSTGGAVLSWSVTPALPAGLSLDTATGVISGTPTAGAISSAYTITGTNSGGTLGLAITFLVVDARPAITAFSASPATTPYGGSSSLNWTLGSGTNDTFSLTLNGSSIAGIPSGNVSAAPVRRTTYTLAATNPLGTTTGSVAVAAKGLDLLAGNTDGPGSLDGPALSARFYNPNSVAVDGNGAVYIADSNNFTIRKLSGGIVSTLAGSAGQNGSVEGTGAAARFQNLNGIAADASGNVYLTGSTQNSIRKISPAGVVTILAGQTDSQPGSADGTGSNAEFHYPSGLAVDGAGNVFVADTGNNTIRKVTAAGVVTTLAGSPGLSGSTDGTGSAARFNSPQGLALDASGNLYISDQGNHTLRQLTPAGVVTTLAGLAGTAGWADGTGSAARFTNPNGLALDPATGDLFVADPGTQTIRKVSATGVVSTVAGTTNSVGSTDGAASSARFSYPASLALLANGNLLILDTGNNTLRTLDATGTVTTTAGQPPLTGTVDATGSLARFSSTQGLAVNALGDTFVADYQNHAIRKISAAGVVSTLALTDSTGQSATLKYPVQLALDASDNLYVVCGDQTIRKITPASVVSILAGSPGAYGSTDGTGSAARFLQPHGIALDASGNVYVADTYNSTLRKITPAGVVTTLAGLAGSPGFGDGTGSAARFFRPMGIAVDASGNVYVSDIYDIRKVTPAGIVTTWAGSATPGGSFQDGTGSSAWFTSPGAMAFDGKGNLYVCDSANQAIRKVTPGAVVTTPLGVGQIPGVVLGGYPGGLFYPMGIAVTPAGDLVISSLNGVVQATLPD